MRYLLFDLGHVLVDVKSMPWLRDHWSGCSDDEVHRRWLDLEPVQAYERGQIETGAFYAGMPAALDADLSPVDFGDLFDSWLVGALPGAEALLSRLGKEFQLGCLSNTNPSHMDKLRETSTLLEILDDRFFSHEMGHMKPTRAAYAHVLEVTGLPAEDIWFFDDSRANIAAAADVGMITSHVFGLQEVIEALRAREL